MFDGASLVIDSTGGDPGLGAAVRRARDDHRHRGPAGVPQAPPRSFAAGPLRRSCPSSRSPTLGRARRPRSARTHRAAGSAAEVYKALVLGTRDYVRKNGFTDVVLGMSGGIDSSLVTVIAADALGAEHVHGVSMPSVYTSDESKSDAEVLADNLGVDFREIAIEPMHSGVPRITRLRLRWSARREPAGPDPRRAAHGPGQQQPQLVGAHRGNKSELAVGYTTVYGVDMAGGFAVIRDVPKTVVYQLCPIRNEVRPSQAIPEYVLTKPPSAELRPGQRDDESLPPYDVLDPILDLGHRQGPHGRRHHRVRANDPRSRAVSRSSTWSTSAGSARRGCV